MSAPDSDPRPDPHTVPDLPSAGSFPSAELVEAMLHLAPEEDDLDPVLRALRARVGSAHASIWNVDPVRASRRPLLLAVHETLPWSDSMRRVVGPPPVSGEAWSKDPAIVLRRAATAAGILDPHVAPLPGSGNLPQALLMVGATGSSPHACDVADVLRRAAAYLSRPVATRITQERSVLIDRILSRLGALSRETSSAPTLEDVGLRVCELLPRAMEIREAAILLHDPDTGRLIGLAACDTVTGRRRARGALASIGVDAAAEFERALSGHVSVLGPAEAAGQAAAFGGYVDVSTGGELAIMPLPVGQGVLGVLLARSAEEESPLARLEAFRLGAIAQRLGMVIENGRMRESYELNVRNFGVLLSLSAEVSSTLDAKDVPSLVARRARDLCEADEAILFLTEPDRATLRPVIVLGGYQEEVMRLRPRIGTGITGVVAESRRGEIVNQAEQDPRSAHVPGTPVEPEAIMSVPLVSADELVGVMSLYKLEGRTFRPHELDIVNIFSSHAAVAIENARLFQRIQEERTRLVTMVQHMQEAVLFGDREGRVLLLNTAARRMLQSPPDGPDPRTLIEMLGDPSLREVRDALEEVRLGKAPNVAQQVDFGGRTLLVSVSAVLGEDETSRIGEVLLFQDLTDHKRIEEQLLESSKMSAIGQLASGVAHEFNNLIAGIYGYAQLLKMNPDPTMVARGVDVILRSSERAQELTNSLLTFSRRRPGRREPTSPVRVIQSSLLLLGREMEKQRIRIETGLPELPVVLGDPGELQQVIVNILINARQAMPDGGVVRIEGREIDGEIELVVQDTGPGISEEHLPRVFEPFFTTKGALAGNAMPGSGLGLTTAYNIVRDHGGRIAAESPPGGGARIVIRLPRADRASLAGGARGAALEAQGISSILVLFEDGAERERLTTLLAGLGHEVIAPAAPEQLAEIVDRGGFDLAILDRLPAPHGEGDYRKLRTRERQLPVIFVASRDEQDDHPGLADAWAFLLRRPFRDRDLASLVARVLARRLSAAS